MAARADLVQHPGLALPLVIVVLAVAFSGCIGEPDAPADEAEHDPAAPPANAGHVTLTYNMTGSCTITELALPGHRDEASRFLPPGFKVAQTQTPFAVVVETCDGGTGGNVHLAVNIESPPVPPRVDEAVAEATAWDDRAFPCDGSPHYYVAGYSDARFWRERYQQAGVATVEARVDQAITLIGTGTEGPLARAEGAARADGEDLFTFDALLDRPGDVVPCRDTWYQSDHGLLRVWELRQVGPGDGRAGQAVCTAAEGHPFAWVLDEVRCAQASAAVSPELGRLGYAFWFHDTFAWSHVTY